MSGPAQPHEAEVQARQAQLLAQEAALLEELSGYEVAIESNRAAPQDHRLRQGAESRLRGVRSELEALGGSVAGEVRLRGSGSSVSSGSGTLDVMTGTEAPAEGTPYASSAADPPAPPSSVGTSQPPAPHPVVAVAGAFVRVADLLGLKLADGDNALSASTRATLTAACSAPVRRTAEGHAVVGPASFLRAALAGATRAGAAASRGQPATLAEAVVAHLWTMTGDQELLARLAAPDAGAVDAGLGMAQGVAPRTPADPAGAASAEGAVADGDLTRMLADAAALTVQLAPGQLRIDLPHALVAALRSWQGQRVFFEVGAVRSEPESFFGRLAEAAVGYLAGGGSGAEAPLPRSAREALPSIVASLAFDPAARPEPPVRSQVRYVADVPARALGDDRLGMAEEARALAEVVCLREPGPPLAIGLFGDWGSGKSTFMNMIEAAVEELTERTRDDAEARRTLVSRVVHVRFNAWHYNDANLWASLTSEFFSQLRSGGVAARVTTDYADLVSDVLERVSRLDGEVAGQAAAVTEAREEAGTLREEIQGLQASQRKKEGQALADAARALVAKTDAGRLPAVCDALATLGHPLELPADQAHDAERVRHALEKRLDFVRSEVERAAQLPGRIAVFLRAVGGGLLTRNGWLTFGLLCASIVLALAFFLASSAPQAEHLWTGALAGVGMLGAAGGGLLRVYRAVEPIFRAADDFTSRRRAVGEALDHEIAGKRAELAAAEARERTAESERARREAEAARFRGGSPERVFDYYLNVSDDTRQFERQLGTVSQVRRAFEQLDAIFQERERLRRDAARPDAGGEAKKALVHLDTVTHGVDRIVLYIDDLDRCQVQQVVKVLEAVHLLLAFPLFVVVVGVDARWLQQSLLDFYQRQLRDVAGGGDGVGSALSGAEQRATVQDYLEKIFQVPIRLGRLTSASEGHFESYLHSVAGPLLEDRASGHRDGADAHGDGSGDREADGDLLGNARREEPAGAGTLRAIDVKLRPEPESAMGTALRLTLRRSELDMIAALAPFLGKSPRAVKRFMNIYRLVRGLRRGRDLEAFLKGAEGTPAPFPAHQFWLALDIGLRPEEVDRYRTALLGLARAGLTAEPLAAALADEVAAEVLAGDARVEEAARDAVALIRRSLDRDTAERQAAALRAVGRALPGPSGLALLVSADAEVQRFSLRQG